MADRQVRNKPKFATTLQNMELDERLRLLQMEHPDHTAFAPSWDVLLDAFESTGGFLDGGYLWPHPREEQFAFTERKDMARYHNYLEALVDLYVRFIFTQNVKRSCKNDDYNAWLQDVDGAGTAFNELLKVYASMALVNGHACMLIDRTPDEPSGPTVADEAAHEIASIFTASAILDWRFDRNNLVGVKLAEEAPNFDLLEPTKEPAAARQYLLWDMEGYARFDAGGELLAADTPNLGLVPLVILRFKPSHVSRMLGRALIGNANVVRALYNRASEQDEVLRNSAFSMLTVAVDKDGDVTEARNQIGSVFGSAKALVVKGQIDYKTPDQAVSGTLGDNMQYLVQEMYRAAHVRLQNADSLAPQSGASLRLQYTELNEMLQGFAKALEQAEREIARAWFAWNYNTPQEAQIAFDDAEVTAQYPDEFFLDDLATDLTALAEAINLRLGSTMTAYVRKQAVRRIDPDIPPDLQEKIDAEIDALPDDMLVPQAPRPDPSALDTGQGQSADTAAAA